MSIPFSPSSWLDTPREKCCDALFQIYTRFSIINAEDYLYHARQIPVICAWHLLVSSQVGNRIIVL
jgi:hypothetical protein